MATTPEQRLTTAINRLEKAAEALEAKVGKLDKLERDLDATRTAVEVLTARIAAFDRGGAVLFLGPRSLEDQIAQTGTDPALGQHTGTPGLGGHS